jgi:Protein of unknown function (DUF3662)/FHA domain
VGLLQRFENRLEQVVSGAFAKAFRSAVQPVELAAALQREVDNSAQILSRDRRLVPNAFHIELSSTDYDRLAPYSETLGRELVDLLREHADEQHYVFTGPVTIDFHQADDLGTGRFRLRSQAEASVSAPTPAPERQGALFGREPNARPKTGLVLEVNGKSQPLTPPGLVIGRGQDADLRINDPGVSRRHAEIRVTASDDDPVVSVVDLGSTNGTLVNGHRVQQAIVTDGGTIRIGNTTMTVRFTTGGGDVE